MTIDLDLDWTPGLTGLIVIPERYISRYSVYPLMTKHCFVQEIQWQMAIWQTARRDNVLIHVVVTACLVDQVGSEPEFKARSDCDYICRP